MAILTRWLHTCAPSSLPLEASAKSKACTGAALVRPLARGPALAAASAPSSAACQGLARPPVAARSVRACRGGAP
eukprot:scaffold48252_cov49-Phaeocystis_antarctica.AAC.4